MKTDQELALHLQELSKFVLELAEAYHMDSDDILTLVGTLHQELLKGHGSKAYAEAAAQHLAGVCNGTPS